MMDIFLDGAPVRGSPTPLTMLAAEIEVAQCEVIATREAVAGSTHRIDIRCRDAFGNDAEPEDLLGPFPCGVLLIGLPSSDKAGGDKKAVAKLSKEERAERVNTLPSIDFTGAFHGATYTVR